LEGVVQSYLVFLGCYLLGAIPFGYLIGRTMGVDVRNFGSGNIGATNVYRVLGRVAFLVLALDVGKGLAAAALGVRYFPGQPWLQIGAGFAAVVGHNWPVFLRFRGGKGVATTAGVFLYLMPVPLVLAVLAFILTVAASRYVSLGSLVLGTVVALGSSLIPFPAAYRWAAWVMLLVIIYRHRANIQRLLRGTELRLGQRSQSRLRGEGGQVSRD